MKKFLLVGITFLGLITLAGMKPAFADDITPDPGNQKTPISVDLRVNTDQIPTLPSGTSDSDHMNTKTKAPFGIAYCPKLLSGSVTLNSSGKQDIDLSNASTAKYHVGVKDLTRLKHHWVLTAQMEWDGTNKSYLAGSTVNLSGGEVKENKNGVLSDLSNSEVTGQDSVTINNSPIEIMESNKEKTQNGFYDYKFDSIKLSIPNVENVPADTYEGNIVWNLSLTPDSSL